MQHHHQQQEVGGGGPQSLGGYGGGAAAEMVLSDDDQKLGDLGIAEAASPISSRPPAPGAIGNNNFEEMIQATATAEAGSSSGNRWPRQETLALLKIRSEMDAAFRDATLKGPLWEQVSRKLAELGYKRSAKKCKEKFENVHKYYKRTKEGRSGRQDGKSYKFFTQLEALSHNTSTAVQVLPRLSNPTSAVAVPLRPPQVPPQPPDAAVVPAISLPPPDHHGAAAAGTGTRDGPTAASVFGNIGISFSSNSSSSSEGEDDEDDDDDDDEEMELMESTDIRNIQRKRKRSSHGAGMDSDERMMDFFEGLLRQVMQKQEAMQQRFLEAIEKREQDRMIREEAWKRQDMARIAREHDLMAQERAISASRDAAIIAFLEKITGQTIHLPTTAPAAAVPPPFEPQEKQQQRQPTFPQQQQYSERQNRRDDQLGVPSNTQQPQSIEIVEAHQLKNTSDDVVAAVPEQQIPLQDLTGGSSLEMSSSRWPKAEVLALIQLRSGMESRYQEAGPKGPLWEEISAGMQRMGYNRSAKRCKEKWENINKYFKKVKESNKKRPEDSKTCPYFHELDALYQKKMLGNTSGSVLLDVGGSSSAHGSLSEPERKQQQQDIGMQSFQSLPSNVSVDKDGRKTELQTSSVAAFSSTQHSQDNIGGEKQPEDMLEKQHQQSHGDKIDNCNTIDCSSSDDLDKENDEDNYEEVDENEEYDDKTEEEMKMFYKIQFQRQNVGSSNGGGTTSSSFVAMVQ